MFSTMIKTIYCVYYVLWHNQCNMHNNTVKSRLFCESNTMFSLKMVYNTPERLGET